MTNRILAAWAFGAATAMARQPAPQSVIPNNANSNVQRSLPQYPAAGPNYLPQPQPFGGGGYQPSVPVQYNPAYRPTLSPYLNLNRGGIPAVNYFNFVRPGTLPDPLYQAQTSMFNNPPTRPGLGVNNDEILEPDSVLRPTGHPAMFLNYGGYFNTSGTIGGAARQGPTGRSPNMRR